MMKFQINYRFMNIKVKNLNSIFFLSVSPVKVFKNG